MLPIPFTLSEAAIAVEDYGLNPALVKAHNDDAAYDLRAAEDGYVEPGKRVLVKTGVRVAIPYGFAGLVLPRSGLALKEGITVLNAPGLIDPGYRGDVGVILHNTNPSVYDYADSGTFALNTFDIFSFKAGDRIAQLLIVKTADVALQFVLPTAFEQYLSERGEGGFGSTGR